MPNPSTILIAIVMTVLVGLLLVRKALSWGFIDVPDARKVHVFPTPRTGGLAAFIGAGIAFGFSWLMGWTKLPQMPWQTWVAGFGFIAVGAADDRFSFLPRQKVLVLLGLAALAATPWIAPLAASWHTGGQPSGYLASALAFLLLTFWFMAVPNAVNIEDAINGYMGGYTLIILLALGIRGVDTWLVTGALFGFLCLNWPKAKHFMGDAGSFGFGFFIAECILRGSGPQHPFLPLILTAPISLDVAVGLLRRKRLGMSFFQADCATCPHHMLKWAGGSVLLATPILWLNAIGFACLVHYPLLATLQALVYFSMLIYFNRNALLRPSRAE